jgi:asparagine synthase (glutamine-hydrolysing)
MGLVTMYEIAGFLPLTPNADLRFSHWLASSLAHLCGADPITVAASGACMGAVGTRANIAAETAVFSDGNLLVAANARLDHVPELLQELGSNTHLNAPSGAAKMIAAAWEKWGTRCPEKLYGDYSFVVFDAAKRAIFCARDHIGTRPFFYALDAERLAFASSIPALLACPGLPQDLDESYVATALLDRAFEPRGGSFYRAIRRLPAGHSLHFVNGQATIERWWNPESNTVLNGISEDEAIAETRRLLDQAVLNRLEGAKGFALHLSGGIDSTVIAAIAVPELAVRCLPSPPGYCWHEVQPDAPPDSEAGWSEAARAALGLSLTSPHLSADELAEMLARDWARCPDVRNLFHEAAIQRAAAGQNVEVILSGWGGDECVSFHGRGLMPKLFVTGRWSALWHQASAPGIRGGLQAIYGAIRRLVIDFKPQASQQGRITSGKSLINPDFARRTKTVPQPRFREFGVQETQLSLLRNSSIAGRIEDWAISGAEQGIEYRYPMLDRRLLEYVLSLPPEMFRRDGEERWLIRQVSRGLIPELVRCNVSKSEPMRGQQLEAALGKAFRLIQQKLKNRSAPPERVHFIDMNKFNARLSRAVETGSGRDRALRLAIQFLDIA